ncbi:SMC family ATPase [Flammeovirgaceae bacterium SG7u.111]|nr:SMC family ATPase [Flammeovirgaceae bacterium SG7u.132]WPO34203.1 SMC family ATPase [Flammeovirgaceae bacterium SG7u.111]
MIPLKLSIEGLYSYREKQTIDFTKLTSNHLFGIFGEVGSGKSAILEAMMFALYGKSDRLAQNENRLYNMLNLQSDKFALELECLSGKSGQEEYKFVYEARRNSKRFEDVKRGRRIISKKVDGEWLPLETATPEEIIGMSAENFRQTVIIPQGKFREFIELGAKSRADMMQELFHLDRFDLSDKVKTLWVANKEQITVVSTRLEQFKELNKALLDERKASFQTLLEEKKGLEEKVRLLQADFSSQEELKKLFAEKASFQQREVTMLAQEPKFENLENELNRYQEAVLHFKSLVDSLRHCEQDINKKDTQLMSLASEKSGVAAEFQSKKAELEAATKAYEEREKIAQQCQDLETLLQLKGKKIALEKVTAKATDLGQQSEQLKAALEQAKLEQKRVQEALKELREKEIDVSLLKDVDHWFEKKETIEKAKKELEGKLQEIVSKQELIQATVFTEFEKESVEIAKDKSLAEGQELLSTALADLEEKKAELEPNIHELRVQNEFAHHSENLVEGEPCPLCGSANHPSPLEAAHVKEELAKLEEQLKQLGERQKQLGKLEEKVVAAKSRFDSEENLKAHQEELLGRKVEERNSHKKAFVWVGFEGKERTEISEKLKAQEAAKAKMKQLQAELEGLNEELEKKRVDMEKVEKEHQEKALEKARLESESEAYRQKMHFPDFIKYIDKPEEELQHSIEKGKRRYEETERVYKELDEAHRVLEQKLTALDSRLAAERENHSQLNERKSTINADIEEKYGQTSFTNLLDVKNTLSLQLDVESERRKIAAFREELREVQSQVAAVVQKIGERVYKEETHVQNEQLLREAERAQQESSRKIGVLETEIGRIEKGLEEQKSLNKELKELEVRQENLSTLSGLFKGKGFVKYISSIYLQNLVKAANVRFLKLTQNNLSLDLNENYEFIVRDQLNGGKTRLLKTLSGGQTFQASLCLALALAENVKSLNESGQSFFFLDEGFGTLDRKSLAVVFETLRSLQRENRIVGIISHVEELQQEIQVSLNITHDKERGSLIGYSWE